MKVYAVRKGRKTGIFTTWNDCKEQVNGFKGAEFKSFDKHSEAMDYLYKSKFEENTKASKIYDLHIYVDGSYKNGATSWAMVVLDKDLKMIDTKSSAFVDDYDSHNVTGEIYGALNAFKYAFDRNMSVTIYHDYNGINHWFKGDWKANTDIAKFYVEQSQHYKNHDIAFKKVKGHSGNQYNELADKLAKRALDEFEL